MIKIFDINNYVKSGEVNGPVTSPQIFLGNSYNYHPKGLMSEDIFGLEGSMDRIKSMSWMDLNTNVIHPVLFDIIAKGLERKIPLLISGEKTYNFNEEGNLVDPPEGEEGSLTGYNDFVENIHRFKFRNPTGGREPVISMMYNNIRDNLFFMNKLIIISPEYRPVEVMEESGRNKIRVDQLTSLYRRILELSIQLKSVTGTIGEVLTNQMQLLLRDLYELVKIKISKKQGMIRNMMLGKRVDLSARAVIAPNPNLKIGEIGVPFKIVCSIFEPYLIYGLSNSPYVSMIPDEFHKAAKEYLGKESILNV